MRLALTFYSVLKMPINDVVSCGVDAENAGQDRRLLRHQVGDMEKLWRMCA